MLQVHQRIDDFEILRLLGKGGMGEVYEAMQQNPTRRVALKILAPWLSQNEESLTRFWREAEVPARLDHPGIVRIITTGKTKDGQAYYTMQLVRGLSLSDLIKRSQQPSQPATLSMPTAWEDTPSAALPPAAPADPLPERSGETMDLPPLARDYLRDRYLPLIRIGVQASRALAFAHRQGYLHRDIKPSNIMIDLHDQVYLVDFGLTRALEGDAMSSSPGCIVGTPWYMSPEQANGKTLDARTDVYSLGVTLYELASQGMGPFTASRSHREAVLEQVRSGQCLPLRTLAPAVPPALERVLLKAMHYRRERRYADAGALADDLEKILTGGAIAAESASGSRRFARSGRRRRAALGGAIAVLILAVAIVAATWLRRSSRHEPDADAAFPPLPASLVHREWDQTVNLFTDRGEPIWHHIVCGKGEFRPLGTRKLDLLALDDSVWIALDNDPQRRPFRFSVELSCKKSRRAGLFFGFGKRDRASDAYHFYVVQLDKSAVTADAPEGKLTVGVVWHRPAAGARGAVLGAVAPLPGPGAEIGLPPTQGYHHLELRVSRDGFGVRVDRGKELVFAAAPLGDGTLDPLGALGIWTDRGYVWFKNAAIAALPPANDP